MNLERIWGSKMAKEYKEGFIVNAKTQVSLRVSDKDMADIRLVTKHSFKYESSDFIRQAIKEKLINDSDIPDTSTRRLAMEQLENELQNVVIFGQYRSYQDPNFIKLLHICGLIGPNSLKNSDPDYLDTIITGTKQALMDIYNVYEPYYYELKVNINSIVKKSTYQRLFTK